MKAKRGQAIDALMAIKLFGSNYARDLLYTLKYLFYYVFL